MEKKRGGKQREMEDGSFCMWWWWCVVAVTHEKNAKAHSYVFNKEKKKAANYVKIHNLHSAHALGEIYFLIRILNPKGKVKKWGDTFINSIISPVII